MKKNIFITLLVVLLIQTFAPRLYAQLGWKLGVVGGEDFAGAATLPSPFEGSTAQGASGFVLGVRSDADIFPMLSLQTELLVTERSFNDNIGSQSWAEHLTYLQIPILLKFNPLDGAIQPYAYLGPDVGIKLSASLDSNAATGINESSLFNTIDLNLDMGLGLQVKILPDVWVFAEGRYTFGLVNVYNNVQSGTNLGDLRARDAKWLAGVMFGL
jgi:hypothetical protein